MKIEFFTFKPPTAHEHRKHEDSSETQEDSILDSNDPLSSNEALFPRSPGSPSPILPLTRTISIRRPVSSGEIGSEIKAMSDETAGLFRALTKHSDANIREISFHALGWQTDGIGSLELPGTIAALYPMAFERLAIYLQGLKGDYPADHKHKDWVFVTGESVPVTRSHAVDLSSRIGYRASLLLITENPRWRYARDLIRGREIGPWLRVHTEPRWLEDWNEAGWEKVYRQSARLLRSRPQALGLAATAWFYDPQLAIISPRLCYCRERLLERGAVMMRVGTSAFDIASATARSSSRRALYEAGKYVPVSYTLLWPRERLLRWDDDCGHSCDPALPG